MCIDLHKGDAGASVCRNEMLWSTQPKMVCLHLCKDVTASGGVCLPAGMSAPRTTGCTHWGIEPQISKALMCHLLGSAFIAVVQLELGDMAITPPACRLRVVHTPQACQRSWRPSTCQKGHPLLQAYTMRVNSRGLVFVYAGEHQQTGACKRR